MIRFIETTRGVHINVSEIVRIEPGPKEGWNSYVVDREGARYAVQRFDVENLLEEGDAICVSSRPGDRAVMAYFDDHKDPQEGWLDVLPIIAWRVEGEVAVPIFIEAPSTSYVGMLLEDGRVICPEDCTFPNQEDFMRAMREREVTRRAELLKRKKTG